MKRNWIFTFNSFAVQTEESNKKMLSLATDTDSKLAGGVSDPEIQALYNDFHPLYEAYRIVSLNYNVVIGNRKGQTLDLVTLLKTGLPEELRIWEGKVRSVYPEDSPQEKAIFPDKRNPFLKGTYEQRVEAVGSLAEKLATDPAFATLAPQVESYYNVLLSTRATQQQKEGAADTVASQRETQRKAVAKGMYVVLGKLMAKFADDSTQIDNYFDLSLIRHNEAFPANSIEVHGQVTIGGTSDPVVGAMVTIGKVNNPEPEVVITDSQGRYKVIGKNLNQSDEGEVRLTVDAPGFQLFEFFFNVELGEVYDINPSMNPAMMKAA